MEAEEEVEENVGEEEEAGGIIGIDAVEDMSEEAGEEQEDVPT